MVRKIAMGIVMAFALGFVGCRSCLSPYEYCQPTFVPERGDQCMGELYRCGSVLGGMEQTKSPTDDCEECNGGYTEYYGAANAAQTAASGETSIAQTQGTVGAYDDANPYAQANYVAPAGAYAGNDYAVSSDASVGAYPQGFAPAYGDAFESNDFNLRDDSGDVYAY
ncbi:MAG: hypothetical protein IJZ10_09185 [Thermoguttaceae bacterium]|nr:hypothetical protein [Thermoguttaceae bacterium]